MAFPENSHFHVIPSPATSCSFPRSVTTNPWMAPSGWGCLANFKRASSSNLWEEKCLIPSSWSRDLPGILRITQGILRGHWEKLYKSIKGKSVELNTFGKQTRDVSSWAVATPGHGIMEFHSPGAWKSLQDHRAQPRTQLCQGHHSPMSPRVTTKPLQHWMLRGPRGERTRNNGRDGSGLFFHLNYGISWYLLGNIPMFPWGFLSMPAELCWVSPHPWGWTQTRPQSFHTQPHPINQLPFN